MKVTQIASYVKIIEMNIIEKERTGSDKKKP
jgi:hypothetical protein